MMDFTVLPKMERFNYTLTTYREGMKATFYIQTKGNNSGRPLRKPIANCVCVETSNPHLFEIIFAMYKGRLFHPQIGGSVIPFIRIRELKEVIDAGLSKYDPKHNEKLKSIESIEKLLASLHEKLRLYNQLQVYICREILT
jgi:hypothetical protein